LEDPEERPEVDYFDHEPIMTKLLDTRARHRIVASVDYMCVNENGDPVKCAKTR
jgi:hypothetical protein